MARPLSSHERMVIKKMVSATDRADYFIEKIPFYRVENMNDGGMGSLKFINADGKECLVGENLIVASFFDTDGVLVYVFIDLDERGEISELDVWKTDFSPLNSYPETEDEIEIFTGEDCY